VGQEIAMDEEKLTKALNVLMTRSVMLECQLLAIRGLLSRKGTITDAEFDRAMALALQTYKELVGGRKTDAEMLEAFLRKFEGPIQ
jgi:hypothetical protein